jgi:hypothetical protein
MPTEKKEIRRAEESLYAAFLNQNLESIKSWVNQYSTLINEPIDNAVCNKLLRSFAIDLNAKNQTLLSISAIIADDIGSNENTLDKYTLDVLRFLLEQKADPNKKIGEPEAFLVDRILSYSSNTGFNDRKRLVIHLLLTFGASYKEMPHKNEFKFGDGKLPTLFALCTHIDGWKYMDTLIEHGAAWNDTHYIQRQSSVSQTMSLIQMAVEVNNQEICALILVKAYQNAHAFSQDDQLALEQLKNRISYFKGRLTLQIWMNLIRTRIVEWVFKEHVSEKAPSRLEEYEIQNILIRIFECSWRGNGNVFYIIIKLWNDLITYIAGAISFCQKTLTNELKNRILGNLYSQIKQEQYWVYQTGTHKDSFFDRLHNEFCNLLALVVKNSQLSLGQATEALSSIIKTTTQESQEIAPLIMG